MADIWANSMACHPHGCLFLKIDIRGHPRAGTTTWRINVMIPEQPITLRGAATGLIQRHVIPEPRIILQDAATWWIHCYDSRATCHLAGRSHLAKSVSWSCHIAGCKNSIRHIENRLSPYFVYFLSFLNAVWALTSDGFRIVSDTLVTILLCSVS